MIRYPKRYEEFLLYRILRDFYYGIKYKIPLCCILRFCWDILHSRFPAKYRRQSYRPDLAWDPNGSGYFDVDFIPCFWFHSYESANIRWINFQ